MNYVLLPGREVVPALALVKMMIYGNIAFISRGADR